MKGLNLLVILLVVGAVVGYLIYKDKIKLGMSKAEETTVDKIKKDSWEVALMSALQDLRIRL